MTRATADTATHPGITSYRRAQNRAASPRAAEALALMRAAAAMDRAVAGGGYGARAAALWANQRLWTVFQADLVEPGNRLPAAIKRDLLSLSFFVDRQTLKALADPRPERVAPLIAIDRTIARGLSGPAPRASSLD